jgi:flagellar basal-body rod protein FlgF/flagellar basal-body rod protein FlgG
LALEGEGYFVVEKDEEEFLTRAGNFTLNGRGELVTADGYRVLGESGGPVTITSPQWRVTPGGAIEQPDGISNLKLVTAPPGDLARAGENLFRPLGEPEPLKPAERRVQSGYLEMSNVSPTTQMMELIEASRAYEANVRMIQNQDELLGTLVTRVLRPV